MSENLGESESSIVEEQSSFCQSNVSKDSNDILFVNGNTTVTVGESASTSTVDGTLVTPTANFKHITKAQVGDYTKRCLFLLVGLVIMSYGVAFSINASLGTSPVSSIPYVTSLISGLSVGTTTIIVNTLIVLLQIPILRKKFKWTRLLQIPVSIVFGLLIDLASLTVASVIPTNYLMQWLFCLVGIVLVAIGVSFEVVANVLTLAGEGFVQSVTMVSRIKFNIMKVIFDLSLVIIAIALSFIFLHRLDGVREGTIAAAVFVGLLAKLCNKFIAPLGNKIFGTKPKE